MWVRGDQDSLLVLQGRRPSVQCWKGSGVKLVSNVVNLVSMTGRVHSPLWEACPLV